MVKQVLERLGLRTIPVIALMALSLMSNANKAFATEPEANNIEMVSPNIQEVEQTKFIPLPKTCKILKHVTIKENDITHYEINLISTDGNDKNYEELEFRELAGSILMNRAIIKGV